ncbi:hypothetical protein CDD82_3061 [Ophiocordyceps australis]|uniref:TECPR1-like DysF domain-containing protein n=1 Tax=Ophiocordyceps australis TaxID=1399860 RepID=A0A2C5ZF23_9HYPO|nr:hypothetical protein CDD82_3061 [Ophiocordyceps australis]
MDDFTAEAVARAQHLPTRDAATPSCSADSADMAASSKGGLRSGLATMRQKATLQDRLVERLLQQVIPLDGHHGASADASPSLPQRPNFNLTTMSHNFRHFNARIGVVFDFQRDVERLFSWCHASHTLSFLAVYSLVCLDPYLLPALPMVLLVFAVLVPAFIARHPAPPRGTLSSEQSVAYSPRGPPLAPATTVRPAKEFSSDFLRNSRDLQNSMGDFTHAYDKIVELLVPLTNFSNEALSSTVFLFLFAGALGLTLIAHIIPWRIIFLLGGWALVLLAHPSVKAVFRAKHQKHVQPHEGEALSWLDRWIAQDVILDSAPETREVEIFELQHHDSDSGEWEPWLFSPSPYDPLSPPRIAGDRPRGSRFFEDVMPPPGWQWSEKKWALDLWSREWVEERIITGVEVETEGERWVYDMYTQHDDRTGVVEYLAKEPPAFRPRASPQPSWEESDDEGGKRGAWRRRRWVRLVKRKVATAEVIS